MNIIDNLILGMLTGGIAFSTDKIIKNPHGCFSKRKIFATKTVIVRTYAVEKLTF